ncbi:type IV pilus assembly protein PilQ [Ekhidna lutea]|uniref:Type IV pilus assembly protein PilQ n=1 Tax=Ekhidna lutea TaxID=447679 RepID=A0A239K8Y0_EKHLU|nr:general secretion pathway protein GspD [Ekhidna lutea]SNT14069.1 type IV pilus assembly protein PilQ [Ekhidna lutea]
MSPTKPILLALISLFCSIKASGQQSFQERLEEIRIELDEKSDSSITQLNDPVTFDIFNAPIQEFLGIIATNHELNLSVDPNINIIVSNRFSNAIVKDVFYFLCQTYELDITFINNIISFKKFIPPALPKKPYSEKQLDIIFNEAESLVSINLIEDSLKHFTRQFTNKTSVNVVYSPDLKNVRISGFLKNIEPEEALEQIAFANNLEIESSGKDFYMFQKPGANKSGDRKTGVARTSDRLGGDFTLEIQRVGVDEMVTINAVNTPIIEIISEISNESDQEYILFSEPEGIITLNVRDIPLLEFFDFLFNASDHTYREESGVFVIGRRNLEGLRTSKIVKLNNRSVDEIDAYIPQELKEGVNISIFKELNALILSGNAPQIKEIELFIKEIDELVPNILIEVIVVDVRKGYNLQTGLQAFLSDSSNSTKTTGSVFPRVDLSLGTNAINEALGAVNLGKVTPRFYAQLKAIEDNNNINIRSTPQLATLNGHEATLTIGQSVFFVQRTQNVNPGVNPVTTVSEQYRQVEANLSILINPIVSGNEHVTLSIDAEFSSFVPPEIENAPPGNATRRFTSKIRVRNEEMIVLGGLEEITKSETSSGVPLLSRIPVLSWLFSAKGKETDNDKLMVFIKPTIVF